jgi:3-oxoacyl-[acyl-carrier protein] reductase
MKALLDQRVALVTGAGRSLGASIARALARHGASVAVNYWQDERAAQAVVTDLRRSGSTAIAVRGDATDPADIAALVTAVRGQLGDIDLLVLSTAGNTSGLFDRVRSGAAALDTIAEIQARTRQTLDAALHACKHVVPGMRRRGGGSIVLIGSAVTHRSSGPWNAEITVAKAAQDALARVLAAELGPYGIRVNVVAPGFMGTDSTAGEAQNQIAASLAAKAPLRRLPALDEVADIVVALASELTRATTGAFLAADAGVTMP